jgi:glycosyltransferase involved in cell wall biosynthesis
MKKKSIKTEPVERSQNPTISICMMVRNEENNLPRLLDSVKKFKLDDELLVFDTGSDDLTVEVAESYGARMIGPAEGETLDDYFEPTQWGKKINFSKARNRSFAEAKSDWILLVDADEELVGDAEKLRVFLKNLKPENDAVAIQFSDIQKGKVHVKFPPPRIFRRGHIEYRGIVHNSPYKFKEPVILFHDLEVHHFGFDLTPEQKKEKTDRTLGLLLRRLEINPSDHGVFFYLAQIYGDLQDYDRCIEYAIKYIRNEPYIERFNQAIFFTLVQACIQADKPEMADKWLAEAVRSMPQDIDIAMALVDYGVWQKKAHIVAAAGEKYIKAYDEMMRNVLSMGSRFVYNFNPHALIKVLFHLSLIRLSQGVAIMEKLREELPKIEPELVVDVKADLVREVDKIIATDWVEFKMGEI